MLDPETINTGIATVVEGLNVGIFAVTEGLNSAGPALGAVADGLTTAAPVLMEAADAAAKGTLEVLTTPPPRPLEVAGMVGAGVAGGVLELGKLAAPVVESGVRAAIPVATEGVKAALPVAQDGLQSLVDAGSTLVDAAQDADKLAVLGEQLKADVASKAAAASTSVTASVSSISLPSPDQAQQLLRSPLGQQASQAAPYALGGLAALVALQKIFSALREALSPYVLPASLALGLLLAVDAYFVVDDFFSSVQ